MLINRNPGPRSRNESSGARRARWQLSIASMMAAIVTAVALAPSAAAVMSCGNAGGSICCGSSYQLPVRWIYLSTWAVPASGSSTWQYNAMRYDQYDNVTYNVSRPTGGNWSFDNNGFHGWRGTKIYRGGSPIMDTSISQATNASSCFG
jgi:hypothetical protein